MVLPPFTAVVVTATKNRMSAHRAVESLLAHHGDAHPLVVLVDDRFALAARSFEAFPGVDVRGPAWLITVLGPELLRLGVIHDADALASVLRPFVLRALLDERRPGPLVSLPADAEVLGPIDALVETGSDRILAVVPTRLSPPPADGKLPDAFDLAMTGRFDQELFAITTDGRPVLDDWCSRLARSPHVGPDRIRADLHPWLDDVAALVDPRVVRDPGIGVSFRNADEPGRSVEPKIVRFEGFDPTRPWLLSERTIGLPRVLLSDHPWLAKRCRARAAALLGVVAGTGSGWDVLANGIVLDPAMRRAYLQGLLDAAGDATNLEPPNPFEPGGSAPFVRWLGEASDALRPASRYLRALHELRPDLKARFADPADAGPDGLRAWARINGRRAGIPAELVPAPEQVSAMRAPPTPPPPNGVNVVGFLQAEMGVGEASRQLLRGVEVSGVPFTAIADTATLHRQHAGLVAAATATTVAATTDGPVHRLNVIALNADALIEFSHARGSGFFAGRRTVGLWFWEVECFPERFAEAFALVDEIWVATEHVRRAIAATTDKPVFVIPLPLPAFPSVPSDATTPTNPAAPTDPTAHFTVTFCFDYASVGERKNPSGAVAAYRAAFPTDGERLPDGRVPRLILKSINADRYAVDREHVLAAISGRSDITLIDDFLDPAENRALIAAADCYLSLHRAEGWGLTMAEAMAAGVPVVATGYSGNLAFMDETNSWLVPYELVAIPPHVREYAGCGRWAEPDIAAAAAALRDIALDPATARNRAERGRRSVQRLADPAAAAQFIRTRTTALVTAFVTAPPFPTPDPEEAPVDAVPSPSNTGLPVPSHPVLDHPGLGPVVLPSPPAAAPAPTGLKGSVRGQIERAIKFEIDHRDQREHARAVALVEEVSLTREAVRAVGSRQLADQDALTTTLSGATDHLRALQAAHDALHTAVTEIGTTAHDSGVALGDVSARLDRIEARLDQLTTAIETLAARSG